MAINVRCDCGKRLKIRDEHAGKRVRCPDCEQLIDVPEQETFDAEEDWVEEDEDNKAPRRRPAASRSGGNRRTRHAPATSGNTGLLVGLGAGAVGLLVIIGIGSLVLKRIRPQQPVPAAPPAIAHNIPFGTVPPMTATPPAQDATNVAPTAASATPPTNAPITPIVPVSVTSNAGNQVWVVLSNFRQQQGQGGVPFNRGYAVDYRIASGQVDPSKEYVLYVSNPSAGGLIEHYLEVDVRLQPQGTIEFAPGPGFGIGTKITASVAWKKGHQKWEKVSGEIAPGGAESLAQAPPTVQQAAGTAAQGKLVALAHAKYGRESGPFPVLSVDFVVQGDVPSGGFYFMVAKTGSGDGWEFDVTHDLRRAPKGEASSLGGRLTGPGAGGAMTLHIERRKSPIRSPFQRDEPEIVSNSVTTQ